MKNLIYNLFDRASGSSKTSEDMNRGLDAQGMTVAAEARIRQEALSTAPAAWINCLTGKKFNWSTFESELVPAWREELAIHLISQDSGPTRFRGMEALRLLLVHEFQTIEGSDRRRFLQMLRRLNTP